ncbi:MAG TPA: hypothetical protein PKV13_01730 [Propionicimonas sp.]|nr:hypothetical protein [Propionicimonas sp.]HRA05326.1 hypothetical protein [Propionicimonas sp.]
MKLQLSDRRLAQILGEDRITAARHDWSRSNVVPKVVAITKRAKQGGHLRPDIDQTHAVMGPTA